MTTYDDSTHAHLRSLNDLLIRERHAITHLRMEQLARIQEEKTELLKRLHQAEPVVDGQEIAIIAAITLNNERNRMLLESGLKIVSRLQDKIFQRSALTYGARVGSLVIGAGPRLLNRSI